MVALLAGNALLDERGGATSPSSDETAAPRADPTLATEPPGATMSSEGTEASADAVLTWVGDVGEGDGQGAWQAMGAASQAHFGTQAAFEAELAALADGYGAWAGAEPEDVIVTPIGTDAEGTLAVVTLVGAVEQDGATARRADAVPVRFVDGDVELEPYAFAGAFEVVVPEDQAEGTDPLAAGEALVVVVPDGAPAPILRIDDATPVVCGTAPGTELTELPDGGGQRCAYEPATLAGGEHALTVAFLGADGDAISAGAQLFEAA
jgi:hypothetical protein